MKFSAFVIPALFAIAVSSSAIPDAEAEPKPVIGFLDGLINGNKDSDNGEDQYDDYDNDYGHHGDHGDHGDHGHDGHHGHHGGPPPPWWRTTTTTAAASSSSSFSASSSFHYSNSSIPAIPSSTVASQSSSSAVHPKPTYVPLWGACYRNGKSLLTDGIECQPGAYCSSNYWYGQCAWKSTVTADGRQPAYGQCGGKGYNGKSVCQEGCICSTFGEYYAQCLTPNNLHFTYF